ncbi:MAG: hypothetical protein GTO40_24820 [Deltaproteobacteria bacterium]|nr:hypothetical protein [Deltaproteobacteria bacterium]
MSRSLYHAVVLVGLIVFAWGCSKEKKETASKPAALPPAEAEKAPSETPSGRYEPVRVVNGGTISGQVLFQGEWKPSNLPVGKDKEVCGTAQSDPSLVVDGGGGIRNAVVRITDIQKGKSPGQVQPVLDQKGCRFRPHVSVVPMGVTLDILNSDGILHNVHSYSKINTPFNIAQPKFRKKITHTFAEPERVSIKCDVHSWMSGWIVVSDHPYYEVTSEAGGFQLKDVPPGKYTVEVWHEKLGVQTKSVSVEPGGDVRLEFQFSKSSGA